MVINCVIGNLSGWILNSIREYITAALGVPSKNESGRRILDFCVKRGLCTGNTFLKQENLYKYIRVARLNEKDIKICG